MKWCRYLILHLCLIGLLIGLPLVGATADSMTGSTHVDMELTPNARPVPLVDPNDPTKTLSDNSSHPVGNSSPNNTGLSLAYVTEGLDFGTQIINPVQDQSYPVNGKSPSLWDGNFVIEIADGRGTHSGWKLNVSGSALKKDDAELSDNEQDSIPLSIRFPAGYAHSSLQDGDYSLVHNGGTVELSNTNQSTATILESPSGFGMGMTTLQLPSDSIRLIVPVNSVKAGTYQASLNWSLLSVP